MGAEPHPPDNEDDQVLGLAVFDALADQAPSREELRLIAAVTDGPLDRFDDDGDTGATYVLENEEEEDGDDNQEGR